MMRSSAEHPEHFRAFIDPQAPDVFRSVLSTSDVWRPDPLDVPEINAEARRVFDDVVDRTSAGTAELVDRLVLMLGSAGTGKTHLMTALRNDLHTSGRGFFTYMQMNTTAPTYADFILANIVASLDQPLRTDVSQARGLDYLARAVVQAAGIVGEEIDAGAVALTLGAKPEFVGIDTSFIAALALVARQEPLTSALAVKYLRNKPLASFERKHVLDLPPRESSLEVIADLAKLLKVLFSVPLVVCLDQLDDVYTSDTDRNAERFNAAIRDIHAMLERSENVVVVLSVLDDQYEGIRPRIQRPHLERIETGTKPVTLDVNAKPEQIAAVLERRLSYLYERADLASDVAATCFPYPDDTPARIAGSRLRYALRLLGDARLASVASHVPPVLAEGAPIVEETPSVDRFSEAWSDARASSTEAPFLTNDLLELLAFALERMSDELPVNWSARLVTGAGDDRLERMRDGTKIVETLSVTNAKPQFGALARQVTKAATLADAVGIPALFVRSQSFPSSPRTAIFKLLGEKIAAGHRPIVVGPTEWAAIGAYRAFFLEHCGDPGFETWVASTKPLSSLPGIQALLRIEDALPALPATLAQPTKQPPDGAAKRTSVQAAVADVATQRAAVVAPRAVDSNAPVVLGVTASKVPVSLEPLRLTRHTAILGGAGSGKTTLAFSLLEELALRDVPAILVDRKGDLCSFADPDAWSRVVDAEERARRDRLREKLDVRLYTPGAKAGRDLAVPALPSNLNGLGDDEADSAARSAALSLAALLDYNPRTKAAAIAVLDRAIVTLGATSDAPMTLRSLTAFIADRDPSLLAGIGHLNARLLDSVAQDLQVLQINARSLIASSSEVLDIERLLGLDEHGTPGKTRVSVISTKALGDGVDMLFWVSRLLEELARFGSRRPRPHLQAVAFFDEADRYLPAASKPITKYPMENLLKRARSAGLGIMLATQSPGDLDYKSRENITTWLAGRVSQERAIEKLTDVLGDAAAKRLPKLLVGEFFFGGIGPPTLFNAALPVIIPKQLDEERILELARD